MSLSQAQPTGRSPARAVEAAAGLSSRCASTGRCRCERRRCARVDHVGDFTLAGDDDVADLSESALGADRPIEAMAASTSICFLDCLIMVSSLKGESPECH